MIKETKTFTHIYSWIAAFAMPFLFCVISAGIIFPNQTELFTYCILGISVIAGIAFAEFVRRKYGFDVFFSKVFGEADIDEKIRFKS